MIKTKTPQIIDAQNGISKIVFFNVSHETVNNLLKTRAYNVVSSVEETIKDLEGKDKVVLTAIKENKAIFKESTIQALYGGMTLADFQSNQDALLIAQIEFINSYVWTGDEAQKNPVKYWNLTSQDLEIVTP